MPETQDTPAERDEKARILAREMRVFRIEMRLLFVALFLLIIFTKN